MVDRLQFYFTPKHASRLNRVEIGVMVHQCLHRRFPRRGEIAAWELTQCRGSPD